MPVGLLFDLSQTLTMTVSTESDSSDGCAGACHCERWTEQQVHCGRHERCAQTQRHCSGGLPVAVEQSSETRGEGPRVGRRQTRGTKDSDELILRGWRAWHSETMTTSLHATLRATHIGCSPPYPIREGTTEPTVTHWRDPDTRVQELPHPERGGRGMAARWAADSLTAATC